MAPAESNVGASMEHALQASAMNGDILWIALLFRAVQNMDILLEWEAKLFKPLPQNAFQDFRLVGSLPTTPNA